MLVTQGTFSHICELDSSLRTGKHKPITALRVKFSSGNDFRKLFHIGRLDIDDVETLVLNVEIPEIDPQIIAAYKRLPVTVDGYAIDVIGVSICVSSARYSSNNCVVMCETWKSEICCIAKMLRGAQGSRNASTGHAPWSEVVRKVVFRHHFQRLLENFPELDSFIIRR